MKHLKKLLGSRLLVDLNENAIVGYMGERQKEGASGRSINMELGELSRVIGSPWRYLWPKVKKLDERKDIGRALLPDEERALLDAAAASKSVLMPVLIRMALMTGLRAGEMIGLKWSQIDFFNRQITVGEAKTAAGTGRVIPINADLLNVLSMHLEWFTGRFGAVRGDHYVFPWGSPMPSNPEKPTVELKTAWLIIRAAAKVNIRWHDLRHTACTKMGEAGVPEETMKAIMGHMSRAMIERYSHSRMAAKRTAMDSLCLTKPGKVDENPDGVPTKSPTVDDTATRQ